MWSTACGPRGATVSVSHAALDGSRRQRRPRPITRRAPESRARAPALWLPIRSSATSGAKRRSAPAAAKNARGPPPRRCTGSSASSPEWSASSGA
jgi:hypothetical protein